MPVSALVLTLSKEPAARQAALTWLASDTRFHLGSEHRDQLPVVLETAELRDGAHVVRQELPDIPGIEFVYVVSVDFSDLETHQPQGAPSPQPNVRT